jgi:hypothetical protein
MKDAGLRWYEYMQYTASANRTALSITFAFIATHNHFVLDRGGKVFNRHAPVIKLKGGATEDDHLALLAYLNSSTACFWMKQVCHNKTNASQKHSTDPARAAYEFAGTALAPLPIPRLDRATFARFATEITELATHRAQWLSGHLLRSLRDAWASSQSLRAAIDTGWHAYDESTARAACLQEELDWTVYRAFDLTDADVSLDIFDMKWRCPLGHRPFEVGVGYIDGVSDRVRVSPTPEHVAGTSLPPWWRGRDAHIHGGALSLLEAREHKRMWRDFERNVDQCEFRAAAARSWCEARIAEDIEEAMKERPEPWSTREATSSTYPDGSILGAVSEFMVEEPAMLFRRQVQNEAVPFLAAYRYTDAGLEKHREWKRVWHHQRREDRGETVPPFDSPPKYDQSDYRDATFWRLRGKLDVPKERFISYPSCESDEDKEPVYGWSGWNHLQQAIALATLYMKRKQGEAWGKDRLVPMLAGLDELLPWVWQWHAAPTAESGGVNPGQYIADFLSAQCRELGITIEDLRAWTPSAVRAPKRVAPESAESVRPTVTAREEALLIVVALAHARPSTRVVLARAFALLYQPALLKRLVPADLKARAARWFRQVKGRLPVGGEFRLALDDLAARGVLVEGPGSAIRLAFGAQGAALQRWWRDEAELALAASDAMTEATLEILAANVPSADRHEMRASA